MQAARLGFRSALRSFSRNAPRVRPALRSAIPKPQQKRFASYQYQRFGQKQKPGEQPYSQFGPVYRVQYVWRNYKPVIVVVGAGGATFYVVNLEEVPVTHRRRFRIVSAESEVALAKQGYDAILQEYRGRILPASHPYTQMVARVVERLLPSAHGLAGDEWTVHVIDDPSQKNAFVIPGNKVFVFTGIFPICEDEEGLAAVLGHEMAHNVAHHMAERASLEIFLIAVPFLVSYIFGVDPSHGQAGSQLLFQLPNSRTQEAEADHIGLLMMAESCYDPEAAVRFWSRMDKAAKETHGEPPQFMSTHPSSHNRMASITQWLPQAREKYNEAGCGMTGGYSKQFKQTFGSGQEQRTARQRVEAGTTGETDEDDFF